MLDVLPRRRCRSRYIRSSSGYAVVERNNAVKTVNILLVILLGLLLVALLLWPSNADAMIGLYPTWEPFSFVGF
jgi:hypothetical protein